MTWATDTLPAFKAWLGPAGETATDAQLTTALELALATVETWLDRPLERLERTEENFCINGVIRTRAWPIDSVSNVTTGGQALEALVDKRAGRIFVPGLWLDYVVTYVGGFDPMPRDLEAALWTVAAALLPGSMSAAAAGLGQPIRRVTTPDVGTVEYAIAGAGDAAGAFLGGALPPQVESVLSRYRAESIVGGA